jgi:phage/plasmid-like protein (TIGR03299 family)
MPAEVETLMYAREVPWHGFGTKVEGLQTAEEAIAAAELDWIVEQKPLFVRDIKNPKGTIKKVDGRVANVRMSDGAVLGVVAPSYRVVQNVDAFAFADAIVETGEAKYETAGALRGGKTVFLSMEIPKEIKVPGDDGEVRPYLLVANGHDGSMALRALITPIRVVCANTLSAALGSHKSEIRLRHTTGIEKRVEEAQRALGLTFAYLDEFEREAERMLLRKITDRDVLRTMLALWPIKEVNPLKLNADELRRVVFAAHPKGRDAEPMVAAKALRMYESSPNLDNIRGTQWGLLNGIVEFLDYGTEYRSREVSAADNRASSILLGGNAATKKQKAADLIAALN